MDPITVGEISVAGGALYVAIRTIEWSITVVRNKKNGGVDRKDVLDEQCREKISDIHTYTQTNKETMGAVRQEVASGGFACVWQDRDEVRDFFDALKDNTRASAETSLALKQLTVEMKKANGR